MRFYIFIFFLFVSTVYVQADDQIDKQPTKIITKIIGFLIFVTFVCPGILGQNSCSSRDEYVNNIYNIKKTNYGVINSYLKNVINCLKLYFII